MNKIVCENDLVKCSQGDAPCKINVVNNSKLFIGNKKVATVNDYTKTSLSCFGMCKSMANPSVAIATTAANGVLQPQPCEPVIVNKWSSQAKTYVDNVKIIIDDSKNTCAYAGNITVIATQVKFES